jgi:hypothetical protein
MHGVKRERGDLPDIEVCSLAGDRLLLRADGTMAPARPSYEKTAVGDGYKVSIVGRTIQEARKIAAGVQRKYPTAPIADALANASLQQKYLDSPITFSFGFGGLLPGRSMVKTAVAMAHRSGIKHRACEAAMPFLTIDEAVPPFGLFYLRDLISERPVDHLFHCVSIKGKPERALLTAYIEYFGMCRVIVLLSREYSGPQFQSTYALDPSTGKEISVSLDLDLTAEELEKAINGLGVLDEPYIGAANDAMSIIVGRSRDRTRDRVIREAFEYAMERLGVAPDGELSSDQAQAFAAYFMEKFTPFLATQLNHDRTGSWEEAT